MASEVEATTAAATMHIGEVATRTDLSLRSPQWS